MRSFAYVALVAIIAVAAAVEADLPDANFSSDKVKVFTSNVELDKALKGKNSVVCFFNARCSHCKQFAPEYVKAATEAPAGVQYVALDAELHNDIPQGFRFRYYPAVFYVDAAGNKIPYTDTRNAFSLSAFVKKSSGSKPSLIEGDVLAHYNAMQGKVELNEADHAGECTRTLSSEAPSLIESSTASTATASVHHPSVLDGEAYNADESMMQDREAAFLNQWETAKPSAVPVVDSQDPVFVAGGAVTANSASTAAELEQEVHAEAEGEVENDHSLAEVDSMDHDMGMEMDLPIDLGM